MLLKKILKHVKQKLHAWCIKSSDVICTKHVCHFYVTTYAFTLLFIQMQDIERHLHVYIAADKWSTLINIQ